MRYLIIAAAMAVSVPATAQDLVFRHEDYSVRLKQEPCELPEHTKALADAGVKHPARRAEIVFGSKTIRACWAEDEEQDVLIGDEFGTKGFLPMFWFQKESSI